MTWSVLLHILHPSEPSAGTDPIIVYGCMVSHLRGCDKTMIPANPPAKIPVEPGWDLQEWRFEIDDQLALNIRRDLAGGELSLSAFGIGNLPAIIAKTGRASTILQPAENIARQQRSTGNRYGVPPGFIAHPTLVESYPLTPEWLPPEHPPQMLASTPTSELPDRNGRYTLKIMQELSGLPFDRAYGERINRFEIMERPAGSGNLTIRTRVLPPRASGGAAFQVLIDSKSAIDLHVIAKCKGEIVFDAIYRDQNAGGFSVPLPISPNTVEVRAFDPMTGSLILHELIRGHFTLSVNMAVAGSSATIDDEISRRAPQGRRKEFDTTTRFSTEIWNLGRTETEIDEAAARLRSHLDLDEQKRALAEWFPVGINGELDVVARLIEWAKEPTVEEMVIVDPFLSPPTFSRLVRRIGREDLKITALASLGREDPDAFGKPADAVRLLQEALDQHSLQFACDLRVLNLVEARHLEDGSVKPGGQAFHDRYVVLRLQGERHRVFALTNSLNKAAGNWPFALSELSATVADQVKAYVDGLLILNDRAGGMDLMATLDWSNTPRGPAKQPKVHFGPKLSVELLRTLAWLLGDPQWHGSTRFTRSSVTRLLLSAKRKGIVTARSPRLRFDVAATKSALKREARHHPPFTAKELATLLMGMGVICSWSQVARKDVGKAFAPYATRRLISGAVKNAFDRIPLEIAGTADFDPGSLWDQQKGRALVLAVNEQIGVPRTNPSPDHRLSGALTIALAIDPAQVVRFVEDVSARPVKEFCLGRILHGLSEIRDDVLVRPPFGAKSLVLRTAAVLFMTKPRAYGYSTPSVADIEFAVRHWDIESQLWGLAIAFDAAMFELRVARSSGVPQRFRSSLQRATELADAIAARWSTGISADMLDTFFDLLDRRGEDVTRLGEAIEQAGHPVDRLWRLLIKNQDKSMGVPDVSITGLELDRTLKTIGDYDPLPETLFAAFAYVVNTRSSRLTRDATRYGPIMAHCWNQVQDPLFFAFREGDWRKRIRVLIGIYMFVYRLLDEASRRSVTNGAAHFAADVGLRVDALLLLLEQYPEDAVKLRTAECMLLARDRIRYDRSGLASFGPTRPRLFDDYIAAMNAASAIPPDFDPLETLIVGCCDKPQARSVISALVADTAEMLLGNPSQTAALDLWWRAVITKPELGRQNLWDNLVSAYARNRSDPTSPDLKDPEREYGLRFGP